MLVAHDHLGPVEGHAMYCAGNLQAGGPLERHAGGLSAGAEYDDGALGQFARLDQASHEQEYHAEPAYRVDQHWPIVACFGETEQRCSYFAGLWQLSADHAAGGEPKHHLQIFRRIAEP